MGRLKVGVLGPLEVTCDGRPMGLGGTKQGAVLAMLAIRPGTPVSVDRLIEGVWGEGAPESVRNVIQVYVAHWRRLFVENGCEATIGLRGGAYVLELAGGEVDTERLASLVETGRRAMADGRHGAAVYAFNEATALVRGDVLQEFTGLPFREWESVPISTALVQLAADRMQCRLAVGQGGELVSELEALVARHPYEERFRAQLMHALYRTGRQVDALRAYERARQALGDLGVDPGPVLREMEQAILRQDSSLDNRGSPFKPAAAPVPLTSLIGREDDVERVVTLARETNERLITLTGPGGVGKTRLGIEVATRIAEQGWMPVAYASLADLPDASLVPAAINGAFGVPESWKERPLPDVAKMLGSSPLLMVIDGAEHLIDAVRDSLRDVLAHGPLLRVLVTSRVAVGLAGERQITVHPLSSTFEEGSSHDGYDQPPAVVLFVERCDRAGEGASFSDTELATIAEICRRVDGLPLGIELAAARSRTLGVEGLLERLSARLDLVATPGRRARARHGSLRSVIEWSYGLLDPTTQRLLARLSVFAGSFTFDHVEKMWSDEAPDILLASFEELDRNSLLTRLSGSSRRRFRLLDTVAEYARERLDEFGETVESHRRLVDWVRAVTDAPELQMGAPASAFEPFEIEVENVRGAVSWALEQLGPDDSADLCASLYVWWMSRARQVELGSWLTIAVQKPIVDRAIRALALQCLGKIESQRAHIDRSDEHLGEAADLWRVLGSVAGLVSCLSTLAETRAIRRDFAGAFESLAEAEALTATTSDLQLQIRALGTESFVALCMGDNARAFGACVRLQPLFETTGWVSPHAKSLCLMARIIRANGDFRQALDVLDRAIELGTGSQTLDAIEHALSQKALTLALHGDRRAALEAVSSCLISLPEGEADPWAILYCAMTTLACTSDEDQGAVRESALTAINRVGTAYPYLEFLEADRQLLQDHMQFETPASHRDQDSDDVDIFVAARKLKEAIDGYLVRLSGRN